MHYLIAFFSIVQFVNITSKLISFRILYLSEFPCISVGELGVANFNLRAPYNCFNVDIDRAKNLLNLIDNAMGKKVADRDSEETIRQFGGCLS